MKKNQEERQQTDSLMTMLDSSDKIFLSFDTARVKNILDSTDHKVELIKEYSPDSLDRETTILLSDYLHIHQALEKFPGERKNILPQISFSLKQLRDMKHDLTDGAMSKEEFAKYFPQELKSISELNSYIRMTSSKVNLLVTQYDLMKSKVDSFITTLDTLHEHEKKNPDLNQGNIDTD